jgi:hypothetical protein
MELSEVNKILLNIATIIAWLFGIFISVVAVAKGKKLREEAGVSFKTYLSLVAVTEVLYTIGAIMILSAMGINVIQHLARLEIWKFYQIMSKFDMSTIQLIGAVGWIGFVINRSISFLSPGYLLIYGGKKLPKYFFYSAWTEVTLEVITSILIFITLKFG